MSVEVTFVKDNTIAVIKTDDDITTDNLESFEKKVKESTEKKCEYYIFDLERVGYICSMGLGVIANLLHKIGRNEKKIYLCGLNDTNKIIFDATKLSDFVVSARNVKEVFKELGVST
ncbi:STAS domain-containing protein [Spirochaetota bacterium]